MEVLHERCAGLDVHKKTVVACVRLARDGKVVPATDNMPLEKGDKVMTRDGNALAGAVVTILGNSQFGQTVSRANGAYDLAVNGARLLTVNFAATGFLPAQRQVQVPWQGFVSVPDVALVPLDTQVTTITANAGYFIQDVLVDGSSIGAVSSYTFPAVTANHTIHANFSLVGGVIAAGSTSTYICPSNPCVVLPVNLARSYSNAVLAFSVKIQLSPNLALCSGTSSISEGSFLSSSGATLFNVIDNGGGAYTVDGSIVGASCGPTALAGNLFNVAVASSDPGGSGSITVTSTKLKDCSNAPLPASAGPAGTVPIDNQAPSVTVTAPNGGEVWLIGTTQSITWTAGDNTGVANVDLDYSTDGGATYPHVIATGIANSGSYAATALNN